MSVPQDNYVWLLQEKKSGKVAVVDPSEFKPVASTIQERYLRTAMSAATHHKPRHLQSSKERGPLYPSHDLTDKQCNAMQGIQT